MRVSELKYVCDYDRMHGARSLLRYMLRGTFIHTGTAAAAIGSGLGVRSLLCQFFMSFGRLVSTNTFLLLCGTIGIRSHRHHQNPINSPSLRTRNGNKFPPGFLHDLVRIVKYCITCTLQQLGIVFFHTLKQCG